MATLEEVYNKIGELLENPDNRNLIVYVDTEGEAGVLNGLATGSNGTIKFTSDIDGFFEEYVLCRI